jgi:hypothetical protein
MPGKAWPFAASYRLQPLLARRKDHKVFALTAACNFRKLADGMIGTSIAPGRRRAPLQNDHLVWRRFGALITSGQIDG